MTVSTNGRSTPWKTGGSWRSLMMPTGTSSMPARTLNASREEEVDVRLFELELARFLEPLDERVLQLELADEPDAWRKAVVEKQDEAMEVEDAVLAASPC